MVTIYFLVRGHIQGHDIYHIRLIITWPWTMIWKNLSFFFFCFLERSGTPLYHMLLFHFFPHCPLRWSIFCELTICIFVNNRWWSCQWFFDFLKNYILHYMYMTLFHAQILLWIHFIWSPLCVTCTMMYVLKYNFPLYLHSSVIYHSNILFYFFTFFFSFSNFIISFSYNLTFSSTNF